jgi:hypothetical protein
MHRLRNQTSPSELLCLFRCAREDGMKGGASGGLRAFEVVSLFVVVGTLVLWIWHHSVHGCWNGVQMALAFFSVINILISFWEIALWRYIDEIGRQYAELQSKYKEDRTRATLDLFVRRLTWGEVFSLRFWTRIWSIYSLYDPSYSDKRSYGFFIDIGNGHTMLLPSLLWIVNMTALAPLAPRWLGIVGIICFYQMFYGTVLYFTSFLTNRRYEGKSALEMFLFVVLSNGIWISFPMLGIWASSRLVLDGTFAVFL